MRKIVFSQNTTKGDGIKIVKERDFERERKVTCIIDSEDLGTDGLCDTALF